ncbi:MAG: hypothetical protein ACQEST_09205 [Bacteroidota bacterium]
MSYAVFLGIINLILLSRLRLITRDEGMNRSDMWVMIVVPLFCLPFLEISLSWVLLAVYLVISPILLKRWEREKQWINRGRIATMMLHVLVVGLLCSPLFSLSANEFAYSVIDWGGDLFFPSSTFTAEIFFTFQLVLFGFLLVLNEANIVLRYLLKVMGLKSLGASKEVDQKEYNTGRVIGLLERIFVFLFVLLNQYGAIGFILAAKGVTRFKDFESRTFAEYVLIGTLLSALLAMAVAFLIGGTL